MTSLNTRLILPTLLVLLSAIQVMFASRLPPVQAPQNVTVLPNSSVSEFDGAMIESRGVALRTLSHGTLGAALCSKHNNYIGSWCDNVATVGSWCNMFGGVIARTYHSDCSEDYVCLQFPGRREHSSMASDCTCSQMVHTRGQSDRPLSRTAFTARTATRHCLETTSITQRVTGSTSSARPFKACLLLTFGKS